MRVGVCQHINLLLEGHHLGGTAVGRVPCAPEHAIVFPAKVVLVVVILVRQANATLGRGNDDHRVGTSVSDYTFEI